MIYTPVSASSLIEDLDGNLPNLTRGSDLILQAIHPYISATKGFLTDFADKGAGALRRAAIPVTLSLTLLLSACSYVPTFLSNSNENTGQASISAGWNYPLQPLIPEPATTPTEIPYENPIVKLARQEIINLTHTLISLYATKTYNSDYINEDQVDTDIFANQESMKRVFDELRAKGASEDIIKELENESKQEWEKFHQAERLAALLSKKYKDVNASWKANLIQIKIIDGKDSSIGSGFLVKKPGGGFYIGSIEHVVKAFEKDKVDVIFILADNTEFPVIPEVVNPEFPDTEKDIYIRLEVSSDPKAQEIIGRFIDRENLDLLEEQSYGSSRYDVVAIPIPRPSGYGINSWDEPPSVGYDFSFAIIMNRDHNDGRYEYILVTGKEPSCQGRSGESVLGVSPSTLLITSVVGSVSSLPGSSYREMPEYGGRLCSRGGTYSTP